MKKIINMTAIFSLILVMQLLYPAAAIPVYAAEATSATGPVVETANETSDGAATEAVTEAVTEVATETTTEASETTTAEETTEAVAGEAAIPEQTEAAPEQVTVDLNGTYHAALGVQTCNTLWAGRYAYFNAEINKEYGTDKYSVLYSGEEKKGNYIEHAGTFQDITIEGNGTYTVSLTGADFLKEVSISQLHVATDIPVNEDITFSDIIVKVNGKKLITFDEAYMETEKKFQSGGMVFLIINHWRAPLEELIENNGLYVNGSGVDCLFGTGDEKIEITFTVNGFAYDKAVEAEVESEGTALSAADSGANAETVETAKDTSLEAEEEADSQPLALLIAIPAAIVIALGFVVFVISKKKKH